VKPLIGILGEIDNSFKAKINYPYVRAIEASGGIPVLLPYMECDETVEALVALCDGFLFTGGADVDPAHYGEERTPACGESQPNRDALELRVFKSAFKTQKPILGICRGTQLINVALGGTLYRDLPSERPGDVAHKQTEPKNDFSHSVNLLADTPLHRLVGVERMRANSFHHQAIKKLGVGLAVMATADDGVIEAVYLEGEHYLRAYQWHPERLCEEDAPSKLLFDDFIAACRAQKRRMNNGKDQDQF
jgi:putative glutamine amidotransferase